MLNSSEETSFVSVFKNSTFKRRGEPSSISSTFTRKKGECYIYVSFRPGYNYIMPSMYENLNGWAPYRIFLTAGLTNYRVDSPL